MSSRSENVLLRHRIKLACSHTLVISALGVVTGFGAAVVGLAVTSPVLLQFAILLSLAPLVIASTILTPRATIIGLCIWLVLLGLMRRVFGGSATSAFLGDPLLLVGPFALLLLFATATGMGSLRNRTPLANRIAALSLLALIEALNPLQGGITVGIGGLLIILAPMLAFWVGRTLVDNSTLRRLFLVVAALGMASAFYGLFQTYVGFPGWDAAWIREKLAAGSYSALNVGNTIRAFASYSSAQEYVTFLTVALVLWVAFGRGFRQIPLLVAAMGLLGAAVFLESGRGPVVEVVAALGVMFAARAGMRPIGAFGGGVVALVLLSIVVGHVAAPPTATPVVQTPTGALVTHQLTGLSDPFNAKSSTFDLHLSRTIKGPEDGIRQPLGHGTDAISVAAQKLGGTSLGTESDPSNAGVAFGVAGIFLYLTILIRGLRGSFHLASHRKDPLSLAVLGLLTVTVLQWLNGDLYSIAWLVWLSLGWVDRQGANTSRPLDRVGSSSIRPINPANNGR